jgi:hypothetical protein
MNNKPTTTYLLTSVSLTLILFFIDEGYYNFKWMTNVGNWLMFVVYAGGIFLLQIIADQLLFRKLSTQMRVALSVLLGLPLGVCSVIGFIFLLQWLMRA